MGEAPALFEVDLHENLSNGGILNSKGYKITIDVVCSKIYAIGAIDCIPLPASFGEKFCHSDILIDKFGPRIEDGKKPSLDGKTLFVTKAPFALVDQIGVQIFCKSSNEWVVPTMLGTIPKSSEGHSAIVLDEDRILVIKGNTYSDDCFWFLEINTPFVRDQRTRLGTEVVAWSKAVIGKSKIPIVISGPSGVGKGTLISKLMEEFPSTFGFSVSHTTRAPRNSESNGVHYHFTERAVMESDIKDGKFLEFATVHGNLYGTSVEAVEVVTDGRKRCILDIDVQGARSVRATSLEAIFIFIRPPSFEELEQRLRTRGTETEEQIQKRLRNAKAEIEQGNSPGLFDHILVNDSLETCYENLKEVLGLSDATKNNKTSVPELVHVTQKHAVSKNGQQIIIYCTAPDQEESVPHTFVLDISSIKGGAPGRTRGLNIYVPKPSSNGYELPS